MLRDGAFVFCALKKPGFGRLGVCDRFLRCERLGSDDEERRFGVETLERLSKMRAVDVGNEMNVGADRKRDASRRIGRTDAKLT